MVFSHLKFFFHIYYLPCISKTGADGFYHPHCTDKETEALRECAVTAQDHTTVK